MLKLNSVFGITHFRTLCKSRQFLILLLIVSIDHENFTPQKKVLLDDTLSILLTTHR